MFTDLRETLFENDTDNNIYEDRRISKCPEINIKLNNIEVTALLDSGSQVDAVSEEWFKINKHHLGKIDILPMSNTVIKGAIGKVSKPVRIQLLLRTEIHNYTDDAVFLVIPGLNKHCILGIKILRLFKCVLDFRDNKLLIENNSYSESNNATIQEVDMFGVNLADDVTRHDFQNAADKVLNINVQQRQKLVDLLCENAEVFQELPGRIAGYEYEIRVSDKTPYFKKSYPVPVALQEKVDKEIQRMIDCKIIERSNGPYVNPLVTVIKKDNSVRLCLDARRINTVMLPDYEGSIPVNEILASCSGIKIMSSIDLKNSFWQVKLARTSRDFTGFMYRGKVYRHAVVPFGLKTSSAGLARALDTVLSAEVKKFTLIYVDDCLVISKSIDEHLTHLKLLLENFRKVNITVNFKKSQLFREEINYLGFRISTTGISTDQEKVAAIMNFPRPKNQKQLKSFLGLTNFYNRFTDKYASCTQPLLLLLKKGTKFQWTDELEQQFRSVKELFIETVVLKYPDSSKQFYLQTDSSKYALGGQLFQYDDEDEIAVVAYTSRTFKGAELRYHTVEKELLGVMHCLAKFRTYLLGKRFTIITDNKALTFLNRCNLSNSRMTRWILATQEYDFDIRHCKGRLNIVADTLSRYPEDGDETLEQPENLEINCVILNLSKGSLKQLRQIAKIQQGNAKIQNIIKELSQSGSMKFKNRYLFHDNKLYRSEKRQWKLYIPEEIQRQLIEDIHTTYGHGGVKRTMEIFRESFATDQLHKITKDIVSRCDLCQRCKDNNRMLHGETKAIVPSRKGDLLSIDFYGPLVTSTAGVRYILVIVDNFTKLVKLYAVKRATTYITLKRLKEYVELHGTPHAVLADNGTQFTTPKWKEGLAAMNIKARWTAIRNPCTNVAERINRQLGNLFRLFIRGTHAGWARQLKTIEACINESYHETIGTTPFQAHYGKPPPRSWNKFLDRKVIKDQHGASAGEIYLRIKEKREREAEKANRMVTLTTFDVGDKVLLRANPMSDAFNKVIGKFCDRYIGPFVITDKVGCATYMLADVNDPRKSRGRFNVRQLKKYKE